MKNIIKVDEFDHSKLLDKSDDLDKVPNLLDYIRNSMSIDVKYPMPSIWVAYIRFPITFEYIYINITVTEPTNE